MHNVDNIDNAIFYHLVQDLSNIIDGKIAYWILFCFIHSKARTYSFFQKKTYFPEHC